MTTERRTTAWAYGFLILAPLLWSGNAVLGRAARDSISPVALTFWRTFIALVVLLPLAGPELWRQRAPLRAQWKQLCALGFLGFCFNQTCAYAALHTTTAVNLLLISASAPLLIALGNRLVFGAEFSRTLAGAIALSMAGILVVVSRGEARTLRSLSFNAGDLLALASTAAFAAYSLLMERRKLPPVSPTALVCAIALGALLFLAPAYAWRTAIGDRIACTLPNVMTLGYLGICGSALAYQCWNRGVTVVGAGRAGFFYNLVPIFGIFLAVVLLGERLSAYHFVGAALVFAGIVLASSSHVNEFLVWNE